MKKLILSVAVLAVINLTAQVKVGSDPLNLATNANFQVEGGTLSTANPEQFVILKNGNVGIATKTPNALLTLSQPLNSTVPYQSYKMANQDVFKISMDTSYWSMIFENLGPEPGEENGIRFVTDNMMTMSINYGRVGIGTTAPDAKLAVNGNVSIVTTPTITGATKVLVKNATTNEISEQVVALGNIPTVSTTSTTALSGDAFVSPNGGGVIVVSPDGLTKWKISVSNTGVLKTTVTP